MVQRILVPLDGSPDAERAIPVAARIARALGGSLILLHVVTPPASSGKFRVPEEYPRVDTDEELAEEAEYLKTLAESDKLSSIAVERYTPVGAVAPAILSATQTSYATLVVLCRHGSTGYRRWARGACSWPHPRHDTASRSL